MWQAVRVAGPIQDYTVHSPFRLRILEHLPAQSSRTIIFRSRLASTFFFNDVSCMTPKDHVFLDIRRVTEQLCKVDPATTKRADYAELAAMVSILDIGIDICVPPSTTSKKDEDEFNRKVDELAQLIKSMFTSIIDTGASHLTRTEAKEVLNRVHYRLAYAVRTKPKPKQDLFQPSIVSGTGHHHHHPSIHDGPLAKFFKKDPSVT